MLDQDEGIEALADRYDAVVRRVARRHRVPRRTARRWFVETVRYLDLCHASVSPLAPSKKVDKAWHEFLLFTRDYAAFCDERYGRFVHHDPYDAPDAEAYKRTYVAYQQRFGRPPDRRIWRDPFVPWAGGTAGFGIGDSGDGGGSSCGGGGCGGGGG